MKKTIIKTLALIGLSFIFVCAYSCGKEEPGGKSTTTTPTGKKPRTFPNVDSLVRTATVVLDVASSTTTSLTEGVTLTDMVMTIAKGGTDTRDQAEHVYILTADLAVKNIAMRVATPNNSTEIPTGEWPRQTLTQMASSLESSSTQVIGMVNADFWNTTTISPRGPLHSNGTVMCSKFDPLGSGKQGVSFVGRSKGGKIMIYPSSEYSTMSSIMTDITGSGLFLVKDGKKVDNSAGPDTERHPRTAIGYTGSNYCFLFCVDGRGAGGSDGMMMDDMGSIFAALGCQDAVNLDGGGSTQMLIRNPSDGSFKICNHPSDGSERAVIDAWAIVKNPQ